MDRDEFAARLIKSVQTARDFAQSLVAETLPAAITFRVRLNQSYDGQAPRWGEARFPQDSDRDRQRSLLRCDATTVVDELWRDGRVPEWVNLSVISQTGASTLVEAVCCGRFTEDDSRLYHLSEGAPPFHVLGPVLPPGHDGDRFSIHHRAECWNRDDLQTHAAFADQVWSFALYTNEFDRLALSELPGFTTMEIFEHEYCALSANALAAFERFAQLRVLRLHLADNDDFAVTSNEARLARLARLADLSISNLPPRPWGCSALAEAAPSLTGLTLSARDTLWLDGDLPAHLQRLHLTADELAGNTRLPAKLDYLSIRLRWGIDNDISTLLDGVQEVRSLSVRGTPVSNNMALQLVQRFRLDHLDLVDTAVTDAGLAQLSASSPGTQILPRRHN